MAQKLIGLQVKTVRVIKLILAVVAALVASLAALPFLPIIGPFHSKEAETSLGDLEEPWRTVVVMDGCDRVFKNLTTALEQGGYESEYIPLTDRQEFLAGLNGVLRINVREGLGGDMESALIEYSNNCYPTITAEVSRDKRSFWGDLERLVDSSYRYGSRDPVVVFSTDTARIYWTK